MLHGHINLNDKRTNIASCLVKEGDIISWRPQSAKTEYYKTLIETIEGKTTPRGLSIDKKKLSAEVLSLPTPEDTEAKFDAQAVVGYYSR